MAADSKTPLRTIASELQSELQLQEEKRDSGFETDPNSEHKSTSTLAPDEELQRRRMRLSSGGLGHSMPNVMQPEGSDAPTERPRGRLSRHLSYRGTPSKLPSPTASPSALRRPIRALSVSRGSYGHGDQMLSPLFLKPPMKRGGSTLMNAEESMRLDRSMSRYRPPGQTRVPARRCRSESPPRSSAADLLDSETRQVFQQRFDRVIRSLQTNLRSYLVSIEQAMDNPLEQGYVLGQLKLIADDILSNSQLNGKYFQEVTESLGKLMTRCDPASNVSQLIKRLLLMISRPARLLECLEFDPEDITRRSSGTNMDQVRVLALNSKNDHIPQYILSRLQTNFGATTTSFGVDDATKGSKTPASSATSSATTATTASASSATRYKPCKQDFKFEKQLSAGAYGAVYLAKHIESNEYVAIKVLKKKDLVTKNLIDQVMNERDILQFAQNPFLVTLYCSFASKESLYMVMEYAPGGDLASLLKTIGCMEERTARRYVAETILAVEYIHEYGIIHRDLKPDNLVIGRDGHIKLTDFGLSKIGLMNRTTLIEMQTRTFKDKTVLGTPDYIAPEVILGQGYGPAVDWWSVGVILYEFILGGPPFRGDSVAQLFRKAVNDPVQFPDEEDFFVSQEAQDLITQLLDKNPDTRLGTPPSFGQNMMIPGAAYVKDHPFFAMTIDSEHFIDFDALLQEKACFVPEIEDDLDTSHFDDRADRYSHTLSNSDSDDSDGGSSVSSEASSIPFQKFDRVNVSTPLANSPRRLFSSPLQAQTSSERRRSSEDIQSPDSTARTSSGRERALTSDAPIPQVPLIAPVNTGSPRLERKRSCSEPSRAIGLLRSASVTSEGRPRSPLHDDSRRGSPTIRIDMHPPDASSIPEVAEHSRHAHSSRHRNFEPLPEDVFTEESPSPYILHTDSEPLGEDFAPILGNTTLPRVREPRPTSPLARSASEIRHRSVTNPVESSSSLHHHQTPMKATLEVTNSHHGSPSGTPVGAMSLSPRGSMVPSSPEDPRYSDLIQKRLKRRESKKLRSKPQCVLGCESCKTISIDWDPESGYGFAIRCETDEYGRRHRVSAVEKGSKAEQAGMEPKTAIIMVDGEDVTNMQHQKVVRKIKEAGFARVPIVLHLEWVTKHGRLAKLAKKLQTSPKLQRRLFPSFRSSRRDKKKRPSNPDNSMPSPMASEGSGNTSPIPRDAPVVEPRESRTWLPSFIRASPSRSSPLGTSDSFKKSSSNRSSGCEGTVSPRQSRMHSLPTDSPKDGLRSHSSFDLLKSLSHRTPVPLNRSSSNPLIIVENASGQVKITGQPSFESPRSNSPLVRALLSKRSDTAVTGISRSTTGTSHDLNTASLCFDDDYEQDQVDFERIPPLMTEPECDMSFKSFASMSPQMHSQPASTPDSPARTTVPNSPSSAVMLARMILTEIPIEGGDISPCASSTVCHSPGNPQSLFPHADLLSSPLAGHSGQSSPRLSLAPTSSTETLHCVRATLDECLEKPLTPQLSVASFEREPSRRSASSIIDGIPSIDITLSPADSPQNGAAKSSVVALHKRTPSGINITEV